MAKGLIEFEGKKYELKEVKKGENKWFMDVMILVDVETKKEKTMYFTPYLRG